jgi:hypothetical protein
MSSALRLFGPANLGGLGELQGEIEAEAARQGTSVGEAATSVIRKCTGKVVHVPGLPDAYDYETFPQEVSHMLLCCIHGFDWASGPLSCRPDPAGPPALIIGG